MKAILIDDEKHALEALKDLLDEYEDIEVVGEYTNPLKAIEEAQTIQYDIAFLDMEMPGMKGLAVADELTDLKPSIEIIFITAYNEYAVDAFEINALDYLLKPVSKKRMLKAVERLYSKAKVSVTDAVTNRNPFRITCFGTFQMIFDEGQEENIKWRTSKARELFAFLVHHRGQVVNKDSIVENLWPDMDNERAIVYLHTCIYQIRKTIKGIKRVNVINIKHVLDGYQLQWNGIDCDVDKFLQVIENKSEIQENTISLYEEAATLYSDDYFGQDDFPWALETKRNLQLSYNELLKKLAIYYMNHDMLDDAAKHLNRLILKNPLHEGFYELLLKVYARMGDRKALVEHYDAMVRIFLEELAIEPRESTQELFKQLRNGLES